MKNNNVYQGVVTPTTHKGSAYATPVERPASSNPSSTPPASTEATTTPTTDNAGKNE